MQWSKEEFDMLQQRLLKEGYKIPKVKGEYIITKETNGVVEKVGRYNISRQFLELYTYI